jgi:hypothetical protein
VKRAPKLILGFFVCDLVVVLLYLANWAIHEPSSKLTRLVDLGGEANLPTWYSSIQLFLVAVFLAVFAQAKFDWKNKSSWALLPWPFLFLGMSFDEVATIHEWLGSRSDALLPGGTRSQSLFKETGIWMFVLGVPFLLLMFGLIYGLKTYLKGRSHVIKRFVIGLIIFAGAALGIEVISNFVPKGGAARILQVSCEELGEMVGATFFLWAAYDLLGSDGFSWNVPGPKEGERH